MRSSQTAQVSVVAGVMLVVALIAVPLTPGLLDLLLTTSFAASVLLLLWVATRDLGQRFAVLPTALAIMTLFRLALNVASTRLILSRGEAGQIIEAFGQEFVSGNPVVGLALFGVVAIVSYLVIARGAERTAEVAARFALDSIPGRQMALESALRDGGMTAEQADERRKAVDLDARLMGNLDGAMKFIKGEAIASVLIMGVNLAAGVAIGVLQLDMSFGTAVETFTVLTVGDGLAAQLPALLATAAAAIHVSSSAVDGSVTYALGQELSRVRRSMTTVGGVLVVASVVPGLPLIPLALVGAALLLAGLSAPKSGGESRSAAGRQLELCVGEELADRLLRDEELSQRMMVLAKLECEERLGVSLPSLTLALRDTGRGTVQLALDGVVYAETEGEVDSHWMLTALEVIAVELVTVDSTTAALSRLSSTDPELVRAIDWCQPVELTLVLRSLVEEGVNIGNLRAVTMGLAQLSAAERSRPQMCVAARAALAREVRQSAKARVAAEGYWQVDAELNDTLWLSIRGTGQTHFGLESSDKAEVLNAVARMREEGGSVVVAERRVRRALWELISPSFPAVSVLAFEELHADAGRRGWLALG